MGDLWDRVKGPFQLAGAVGGAAMYVKPKDAFDGLYDILTFGGIPSPTIEVYGAKILRIIGLVLIAWAVFSATWSFITYELWRYFNKISSPFIGEPVDHFYKVQGKWKSFDGRKYKLKEGDRILTKDVFSPPVTFRFSAKTDSTDIRFGYIAKNCILRWRDRPNEFRIGGDIDDSPTPLDHHHKPDVVFIEPNTWVVVDVIVTPDSYVVKVDGGTVFNEPVDLSGSQDVFLVRQGEGSTVWVRSLLVEKLSPAEPQYKPRFNPKFIVYADYGNEEKGFDYWTKTGRTPQMLADSLKEFFKRSLPEKLTNKLLGIHDPEITDHKQLRFKLTDGKCFSIDEYARITIDSAMPIPPFQIPANSSNPLIS